MQNYDNSSRGGSGGGRYSSRGSSNRGGYRGSSSSYSSNPRRGYATNSRGRDEGGQYSSDRGQYSSNRSRYSSAQRGGSSRFGGRDSRENRREDPSKPVYVGRGSLDAKGNVLPGRVLRFRRSEMPNENHNVVVMGKIDAKTKVKLCFGCGAYIGRLDGENLETSTTESPRPYRYTTLDDMELCPRCQGLEDASFDEAKDAIGNVDMKVFENQVRTLKWKKALIIIVVDATDIRGSFLPWKKMAMIVGSNPIFIAVTKCDLLPKVTKNMVREWQELATKLYGENVLRVYPLSGLTGAGVFRLAKIAFKFVEHNEHNVYVIGQANIGKSTLSRALADNYFRHIDFTDPRGWGRKKAFGRLMPTVSSLPGTTLMSIRLPCFDSPNHSVWDTPGLIPRPVPWIQNRLALQPPRPITPKKYKLIEGTCMVIGYPGRQIIRIEVNRSSPAQPVSDFRLAVWQSPATIDVPIRVLTTEDALNEKPDENETENQQGPNANRSDKYNSDDDDYGSEYETEESLAVQREEEDYESDNQGKASPSKIKLGILSTRDKWRELTISPNTAFRGQDLVLGGLGWIAMNGRVAAEVTIYIRDDPNLVIEAELRDCMYDPYMKMEEIRALSSFNHGQKGEELEFDFSRSGAIKQESLREKFMFNVKYHEHVDKKKETKDLWADWIEGGIRDRAGRITGQVLH
eukprot:CAMPEP_0182441070 /NCGR_PEP_ID=MMETSP1172-20130603/27_1 /TAXON_ID=708627 /ORGANISM="Timspurckia oligopyrenoides, Strain CCMP3278" /LENGTH=686 /DNA_ID=CAMNT_0024635211 /DNA_START=208 /DNA_END=2268 /DNA_ORIENTATION=+